MDFLPHSNPSPGGEGLIIQDKKPLLFQEKGFGDEADLPGRSLFSVLSVSSCK
jgi:hypothetical protein